MSAEAIAKALGGHKSGVGWIARCPAHEDHKPSLSIKEGNDGKVLVKCFAGCSQDQVIANLRSRGLWSKHNGQKIGPLRSLAPAVECDSNGDRRDAANGIWQKTQPSAGTLAETYLRSRQLVLPATESIRFHPHLKHVSGRQWPALVASVTNAMTGEFFGIHRTYLAVDGSGKAPVSPAKMMLGVCRGCVVRLAKHDGCLLIGEGIETCLAAMQSTGIPAWAALSTSGMKSLELPHEIQDVIILADRDDPGESAALQAAHRWKNDGRRLRIARPPPGLDFNDMLLAKRNHH